VDPDPDPHQNVMDPQHRYRNHSEQFISITFDIYLYILFLSYIFTGLETYCLRSGYYTVREAENIDHVTLTCPPADSPICLIGLR
jgi:hypothetical protein